MDVTSYLQLLGSTVHVVRTRSAVKQTESQSRPKQRAVQQQSWEEFTPRQNIFPTTQRKHGAGR